MLCRTPRGVDRRGRAYFDRALKIGGPGCFTDQTGLARTSLGALIGRGGMGEVYEAHSTARAITTHAVVKFLARRHARRLN